MPSLRIVPDVTHFDFTRFRRISFPISAALSIVAITLFFTHGLNFGIDFKGGTLMEVQSKSGAADIATMRATLGNLGLGDVQLQQFGGHAIHSFTAVMMFGVVLVGTYTSIFIAAPILIYLGVGTHRDAPEKPSKKK